VQALQGYKQLLLRADSEQLSLPTMSAQLLLMKFDLWARHLLI
jgi:hypothetical protein